MLKNSSFQWWYLLFFFTFLQGFHQLCVLCLSPFHHDFHLPNACNLTSFLCPLNSSLFALVQPFNLKHSCLGDLLSDSHVGDPEQTWDYLISVWSFSTSPVFLYPLFSIIGYSGMFVLEKKSEFLLQFIWNIQQRTPVNSFTSSVLISFQEVFRLRMNATQYIHSNF